MPACDGSLTGFRRSRTLAGGGDLPPQVSLTLFFLILGVERRKRRRGGKAGAREVTTRLARAAGTDFKTIKELNPEIRGHYLAPGLHRVLIPKGQTGEFNRQYPELLKQWLVRHSSMVYIVKKGDNLTAIAERFNVPLPALFIWNRLKLKQHIYPGDRLIIYPNNPATLPFKEIP